MVATTVIGRCKCAQCFGDGDCRNAERFGLIDFISFGTCRTWARPVLCILVTGYKLAEDTGSVGNNGAD